MDKHTIKYQVVKYKKNTFHLHFQDKHDVSIHNKRHISYLRNYFKTMDVKTIIIENNYIDRHYLEDYSEYYVRCFRDYGKVCKRLHFFKDGEGLDGFTEKDFNLYLEGSASPVNINRLKNNYIGFIVVKPIPETIIGRTCLQAYDKEGKSTVRYYPITKDFDVGLFGIKLKVSNTLPFQEQDKVISACATSSLWSLLHAIDSSKSYHIKSPAKITKLATANLTPKNATYPISGLTPEMMANALLSEGLEAHHISLTAFFKDDQYEWIKGVKENIYAYIKNKIPIILGLDVYKKTFHSKFIEHIGKHAVTICGYSFPNTINYKLIVKNKFMVKADFINGLFVHDDQVGPFARIEIVNAPLYAKASTSNYDVVYKDKIDYYFKTQIDGIEDYQLALPNNLLLGLYHKIRIQYPVIRESVRSFDIFINKIFDDYEAVKCLIYNNVAKNIIWDIHLITATELKHEIMSNRNLVGKPLLSILTANLPKYIWRSRAEYENKFLFDLLFDATDIPQGNIFMRSVEYDENIGLLFNTVFGLGGNNLLQSVQFDNKLLVSKIIKTMCHNMKEIEDPLTKLYGAPRYPLDFKEHERMPNGALKLLQNIVQLKSESTFTLDNSVVYLWAVSEAGSLLIAPESGDPPLGHPNLLNGEKARICGEVKFNHDNNKWIINNASGRYSRYAPDITRKTLENVLYQLFERYLPNYKNTMTYELSEYHGAHDISTFDQLIVKLSSICYKINHDTLHTIAEIANCSQIANVSDQLIEILASNKSNETVLVLAWFLKHHLDVAGCQEITNNINTIIELYYKYENTEIKTAIVTSLVCIYKLAAYDETTKTSLIELYKNYLGNYSIMPKTNIIEDIITITQDYDSITT